MGQSAILVEQVSAELYATAATARKLQEEAASAEALAAMNRDQVEAVRRMLDSDLTATPAPVNGPARKSARTSGGRPASHASSSSGPVSGSVQVSTGSQPRSTQSSQPPSPGSTSTSPAPAGVRAGAEAEVQLALVGHPELRAHPCLTTLPGPNTPACLQMLACLRTD